MSEMKCVPLPFGIQYLNSITLPTKTVDNSALQEWIVLPASSTEWVDIELTVDNFSSIVCTTDYIDPLVKYKAVDLNIGPDRIYFIVKGVPTYISTAFGAHFLTLLIKSEQPTPATFSGVIHMYGMRAD